MTETPPEETDPQWQYASRYADASPESADAQTNWVLDDGSVSEFGPVESALRKDLADLKVKHPLSGTLLASAFALARKMDQAHGKMSGMMLAAVARELREFVKVVKEHAGDDAETTDHRSNLSTPV